MATIKEVADAAGVSTATVSRVLSGISVTESLRGRVIEAAKALDYAPNAAARSLRTTRAAKILVIVPDIANVDTLGNRKSVFSAHTDCAKKRQSFERAS